MIKIERLEFLQKYGRVAQAVWDQDSSGAAGTSNSTPQQTWTHNIVEEEEMVGLKRHQEDIMKQLVNTDVMNHATILVAGHGGSGKSEQYMSLDQGVAMIEEKLRSYLEDKKYLVGLDDVWSKQGSFIPLDNVLPINNNGSRIVVTARKNEVANADYTHELHGLSQEEAWDLLLIRSWIAEGFLEEELGKTRCISELQNLVKVGLQGSKYNANLKPAEAFEALPSLMELEMVDYYTGEELEFKAGRFKSLKTLHIEEFDELSEVVVENYAIPNLENLTICKCNKLKSVPLGVFDRKPVEFLVFDMNEEFFSNLQSENKAKNSHKQDLEPGIGSSLCYYTGAQSFSKLEHYKLIALKIFKFL
ncbi:hypothetical protein FEM48_Zijuj01G0095100 [Ziziphus jujuba var. spinosa]|uniref:NB-ARC domain-containing protein n=1 Tax=Ziziphus jujuba var. spinosa TaxID=714518 RepID=A0A978W0G5_ZIZJJ|nr:hypothetical protein FEM48_Zijuj01G0095100 [Ziziphus jujuba var. spinosa]